MGYLACKLFRLLSARLARNFAEAGITITVEQWRVLLHLSMSDGLTQNELTERLTQDKTGVSRLVKELEVRGMVRRVADPRDRRSRRVHILARGREMQERCLALALENLKAAQDGVGADELAACLNVLRRVVANLHS